MGAMLQTIDIRGARSKADVLDVLARELSFPDWWGRNWDACWDCMTDPQMSDLPSQLHVTGVRDLLERLPKDGEILARLMEDLDKTRNDVVVSYD